MKLNLTVQDLLLIHVPKYWSISLYVTFPGLALLLKNHRRQRSVPDYQ